MKPKDKIKSPLELHMKQASRAATEILIRLSEHHPESASEYKNLIKAIANQTATAVDKTKYLEQFRELLKLID